MAMVAGVPSFGTQPGADAGEVERDDGQRERRRAQTRVQRPVPEHELQVLGEQEERAAHAEGDEDRARDRADERWLRKKCMSSIGYGMWSSHSTKPARTATPIDGGSRTWVEVQPCSGPEMIAYTTPVMPMVESSAPSRSGRSPCGFLDSGTSATTANRPISRDRDVDQEDRAPPEVVEHDPADQRTGREAEGVDGGPEADRLDPLGVVEDLHDDGEGRGHQQRAADAHARAGGDQLAGDCASPAASEPMPKSARPRPASSCGRSGRRRCPR